MTFFKQLFQLGAGLDVCIKVKEKNGKLTVLFTPEVGNKPAVGGKVITGMPEELDADFFAEIKKTISIQAGTSVQDLPTEQTPAKAAPEKQSTKTAAKKKTDKPAGKKGAVTKKKTVPAVSELSMFEQPAAELEEPENEEQEEEESEPEADDSTDTDEETNSETE